MDDMTKAMPYSLKFIFLMSENGIASKSSLPELE